MVSPVTLPFIMDSNIQTEQPETEESGFHLPAEVLDGQEYQEGDTITLKVLSVDPDGGCQVEVSDGKEDEAGQGTDWRTDLRETMSKSEE